MTQPAVRQPIPVGKYFLDRGKISQHQLELALQHRGEFGLKLGQSLVELGFVTEADMVEALRHQARFPCIHLTAGIVDTRVAAKLGEPDSRRLNALALNQIAEHTTVALEDPSDPVALEELARLLGSRIFPVYAEPSVIQRFIDQTFGSARDNTASHAAASSTRPQPAVPKTARPPAAAREPVPDTGAPPDDRAVVEYVRGFLLQAFEQGASDIHLEARRNELVVRFRLHGGLHEHSRLPGSWTKPAVACLKALAHIDRKDDEDPAHEEPAAREGTIPFVFRKQSLEVHIATLPTLHGESAVLHVFGGGRLHRDLDHLGLAQDELARLESILAARDGLLLVVGPAGSGRTTTLNALLARLATPDRKVVALTGRAGNELDGVLYVHADERAGIEPAARMHALLGQDPDLLVVTEIEGHGLARSLVDAALAGRGVLAVQHARGALESLTRLVHFGLEPYLLADVLRGVVAQRLVRRICADCKTPIVPDEALLARLDLPHDGATYFEGEGCDACHGTGFSGRIGLFEVLGATSSVRRELEKGARLEALTSAAKADGFRSLREHGLQQARAGLTTLHEVLVATTGT